MSKFLFVIFMLAGSGMALSQSDQETARYITYQELIRTLEGIIKNKLEDSEVIRNEFLELQKSHKVSSSEKVYRDFVRVRTAFEATRDSGLWQIRWAITDKEPNSDSIWEQWNNHKVPLPVTEKNQRPTAVAECDELSALFAIISRALGVENVGLFWPTLNHTVAVWTTEDNQGHPVRIVVPTSQIFLSANATLATSEFDPYKQKYIYKYRRKDIKKDHKIPLAMAELMIAQVKEHGAKSSSYLQNRRNQLSEKIGGS